MQYQEFHSMLGNLRELNLNGCREISDKTIYNIIARHCIKLERVELYWNCRVNDFCIKKLGQSCTKLRHVNLAGCKYVSDAPIATMLEHCPDITHLNLTRLGKITENTLKAIGSASSYENLTYLNLYANAMIPDEGFRALT